MINEEIVKLVGADGILGLLGGLSVDRRQKLGANRRIDDIRQDRSDLTSHFFRVPGDDRPDKRFRDAAVDVVHRHLVAAVGRPAERRFGQVAGANGQAAFAVGDVHQYLRALPRLGVLIGRVVEIIRMRDILEMAFQGALDVDRPVFYAKLFHQGAGVALRAAGSSETGHRDAKDRSRAETAQSLGFPCDKQRQSGVKAAGHADNGAFGLGMLHASLKAAALDGENLLAPRVP